MASPPYSPVRRAGEWAAISGQIGIDDSGLVEGFAAQLRQVLANLDALLTENDLRRDQLVKVTVFLTDMADYAELNEIYLEFLGEHRPARSAIAVAELPFGAAVEIEAWAYLG